MNLANVLTTARILLAPCCILFIMWNIPHHRLFAFCIFVLAFLTDALDGYAARVKKEITTFGKFYDPLADKILIISVLFSIAISIDKAWCWWALGVICIREIFVALMRRWRAPQGVSVEPNAYGKFKTWLQGMALCGLILDVIIAPYLLWTAVLFSVYSGLYYVASWRVRQQGMSAPTGER